ncbi:chain-length determining protein [Betaproteobacteria bacterium]|nr:chain-length determining protein [Betaproteobacteria bacterium]GHU27523.1 chain-length determining protein [Betaproteobacteria bacterium]
MEDLVRLITIHLRGMWRFRWWGLTLAWIVGVVGGIVVYGIPDKYESSARVEVDTKSLLTPYLSGTAIVDLNADQRVMMVGKTMISRPRVERLIDMSDLGLGATTPAQHEALITTVTKSLQIRGSGRDGLYFLTYTDTKPERAQRMVREAVELFVKEGQERTAPTNVAPFLEQQIRQYEEKLAESESRLKDFRLKYMYLFDDAGGRDVVGQVGKLNEDLSRAQLESSEARQARDALQAQLAGSQRGGTPTVPAAVMEIEGRITAVRRQLDELRQRYTDQHPDVSGAQRILDELVAQKKEALEVWEKNPTLSLSDANPVLVQMKLEADAKVASMEARVAEYQKRLARLSDLVRQQPEVDSEREQLNRDYDIIKSQYENLVKKREQYSVGSDAATVTFRLIDPPSLPTRPSAPNRLLLMPLVGLAALGVGAAFTFLISQLKPSFIDAHGLREELGLPVLGVVSMLSTPERQRRRIQGLLSFGGGVVGFVMVMAAATLLVNFLQG